MAAIRHVLYPTDFSKSAEQALAPAVGIAARHKAHLTIAHVVALHAEDPAVQEQRFPDASKIEGLLPSGDKSPIDVDRVTLHGNSAADEIISFAAKSRADIIVMGSHGRRGFSRALLGSETERVLRLAPCPVLTISEKMERTHEYPPRRILVPVDFSASSDEALGRALALADDVGAQVDVVHVIDQPILPPFLMDHTAAYLTFDPKMEKRCLESMDRHLAKMPHRVPVTKHVLGGRVVPTLGDFAKRLGSDLIVIGTRGLSGLDFILLGSTASQLLRVAPCMILTVHGPVAMPTARAHA